MSLKVLAYISSGSHLMPDDRALHGRDVIPHPCPRIAHQLSDRNYRRPIIACANTVAVSAQDRDAYAKKFSSVCLVKKLSLLYIAVFPYTS